MSLYSFSMSSDSTPAPKNPAVIEALGSQVRGHPGVMTTEDGSLLIKPATPGELAFYETLKAATKKAYPNLVKLRDYTPEYLGTFRLEGQFEPGSEQSGVRRIQLVGTRSVSLVMKNLSYSFSKPNVLDCKLGRVLYDHEEPADKIQRRKETARSTTSWKSGFRLTGFQVYDNHAGLAVTTPKAYGMSIKVSDLLDGVARFFPVAVPDDNEECSRMGLPAQTLLPILLGIRSEIVQIKAALKATSLRMVGGSLLIMYESDWNKAEVGIRRYLEKRGGDIKDEGYDEFDAAEYEKVRDDDGEEEGEAVLAKDVHAQAEVTELDADDEEEGTDEKNDEDDKEKEEPPIPFVVKLIDFANTRLVEPHLGYDQGVDRGLDTVLKLLTTRIKQVKEKL
ncbi:inositol polyphosphate multikinase [Coprinopsis sp. MPI-PUGE-AT-0042]|nr:inositol polyphosphate multikinase [Coprinopsis sp. MPI-PUGE-AT-0042]